MAKAPYVWTHLIVSLPSRVFPQQLPFQHSLYCDIIRLVSDKEEAEELWSLQWRLNKSYCIAGDWIFFAQAPAVNTALMRKSPTSVCKERRHSLKGLVIFFPRNGQWQDSRDIASLCCSPLTQSSFALWHWPRRWLLKGANQQVTAHSGASCSLTCVLLRHNPQLSSQHYSELLQDWFPHEL